MTAQTFEKSIEQVVMVEQACNEIRQAIQAGGLKVADAQAIGKRLG